MIVISNIIFLNFSAFKHQSAANIFEVLGIPTDYLPKNNVIGTCTFTGSSASLIAGQCLLQTNGVVTAIINCVGNTQDYNNNNLHGSFIYTI